MRTEANQQGAVGADRSGIASVTGASISAWGLTGALHACQLLAGCTPPSACEGSGLPVLCREGEKTIRTRFAFGPEAIAYADLDTDGVGDLVTSNDTHGTVTIIWGGPVGFDGKAVTWSIGAEVADLVIADLDADSYLDIATLLPKSNEVAVLRGSGYRNFLAPEYHAAGSAPRALIAADLDGVAPPELITANLNDGTVCILRQLVANAPIVAGPSPRELVAGDFNGDGYNDLAVALADAGAVQMLFGTGDGDLIPGPKHIVGSAPYGIATSDFDGDGSSDIVTANALDDTISVFWGDGAGDLRAQSNWPTIVQPERLAIVPNGSSPSLVAVLSRVTSTIQLIDPRSGVAYRGAVEGLATAIVSDGRGSIFYANAKKGQIGVMSLGIGLNFSPLWMGPEASYVWPVDLESDGTDELLVVEPGSDFGALHLWRDGAGSIKEVATSLNESPRGAKAGKLTGDGDLDVVVWSSKAAVVLVQKPEDIRLLINGKPETSEQPILDVVINESIEH